MFVVKVAVRDSPITQRMSAPGSELESYILQIVMNKRGPAGAPILNDVFWFCLVYY